MKFLTKYSGFLAVLCIVDGAHAALVQHGTNKTDGRVSVAGGVSAAQMNARRLPTMLSAKSVASGAKITSTSTTTTTTTTDDDASLLSKTDCIDKYTECIKETDACGSSFEECTTSELFYAKKPQCNSVLLQCNASGIEALFGIDNTTDLAAKNDNGEYMYPTSGSILGQFIEAGHINNMYDTSQCVKRVTSCLKKDNVCGDAFELCTTNKEFKKQKLFCESTFARCQEGGIRELFGSANSSDSPSSTSRLGVMISEGAETAAVNAVSTCYKVADQCILSACTANPYRCIVDSSLAVATITDAVNEGKGLPPEQAEAVSDATTQKQVSGFIMNACLDTIGANKFCYATVNEGKMPTASQLLDPDNRDEVYADVYSSRMNAGMIDKIQKMADKFDKKAKDKCTETIMGCAMRSCGSGLGSMCYSLVFGQGRQMGDFKGTINGDSSYQEIKNGCEAIVNTDANCQYAAATANATTYNYNYSESGTFGTLFPAYSESTADPLGVVAKLNATLADNYNDAAIAALAKQCKNTAVSCIKSMCGSEYTNCYRNRTDIMSDTYDTGNAAFDHSMNKVGGVLDFTIVTGLCMETVKNASACDEHLKIQGVRYLSQNGDNKSGWAGASDVRTAWVDAVKGGYKQSKSYDVEVLVGCTVGSTSTSETCKAKAGNPNMVEDCGYVDADGCIYDTEYKITETDYAFNMSADSLFREVLGDIEKEAQAKYNAKITKEQNMCIGANNGGLMGARDMSSTYMWVKLKSKRIPKNYSISGLGVNDFVASNDLYGSFCRARVTIQSDDPAIQTALQKKNQNWSTAYFAVGDVFTCGSWIPQEKLEEIAKIASGQVEGTEKYERYEQQKAKDNRNANWIAAASALAGGVGVGFLANKLQDGNLLGGLLNKNANTSTVARNNKAKAESCRSIANKIMQGVGGKGTTFIYQGAKAETNNFYGEAKRLDKILAGIKDSNNKDLVLDVAEQCNPEQKTDNEEHDISKTYADCYAAASDAQMKCQEVIDNDGEIEVNSKQDNTRRWISIGAGAAAATGTFFLVKKAVKDAKDSKLTQEQQDAYDKFMREVGDHIYCFIGADEAGTYGDLIEISVE